MTTLLLDILTTAVPATVNQVSTTMTLAPSTENQDLTTMPLATTESIYHKVQCTDIEKKYAQCLNGVCLSIPAGDHLEIFCHCHEGYAGRRCELVDEIDWSALGVSSGRQMISTPMGIAIIVLLSCILLAIAALTCVLFRKKVKVCGKQQSVNTKSLLQQISYSNYHGMRVVNTDLSNIDASRSSIIFEGTMQSPLEQNNLFSTYVNGGSDVVSDSACAKPEAVIIIQNNNNNNISKQDLVKCDNQLSNITLAK